MPIFGDLPSDLSSEEMDAALALDNPRPVEPLRIVGYSAEKDERGARQRFEFRFDVSVSMRPERLIAALNRAEHVRNPETGKREPRLAPDDAARLIADIVVPEQRERFIETMERRDLVFSEHMLETLVKWISDTWQDGSGRPLERISGSDNGTKRPEPIAVVVHDGRVST